MLENKTLHFIVNDKSRKVFSFMLKCFPNWKVVFQKNTIEMNSFRIYIFINVIIIPLRHTDHASFYVHNFTCIFSCFFFMCL